jgi:hypothetical protein
MTLSSGGRGGVAVEMDDPTQGGRVEVLLADAFGDADAHDGNGDEAVRGDTTAAAAASARGPGTGGDEDGDGATRRGGSSSTPHHTIAPSIKLVDVYASDESNGDAAGGGRGGGGGRGKCLPWSSSSSSSASSGKGRR